MHQLSTKASYDFEKRRKGFYKVVTSLMFLLRQGLAIRGHNDISSNFHQLLRLRCEDDSDFKTFVSNGKFISHDATNEVMNILGTELLRELLKDIGNNQFFFSYC